MTRAILVLVLLEFAGVARAGGFDDAKQCASTSGDLSIHYCTRAIQSGELSDPVLAEAFYNRVNEYVDTKYGARARPRAVYEGETPSQPASM